MHNYYHRALHGAPVLRAARVGDRQAARILATRPGTSKSTETRKETCNQRVKRQNFLPPHILFVRVVTARTTVSLRVFKDAWPSEIWSIARRNIDSRSEMIEFLMKGSLRQISSICTKSYETNCPYTGYCEIIVYMLQIH